LTFDEQYITYIGYNDKSAREIQVLKREKPKTEYVTTMEVMDLAGVARTTVHWWESTGKLCAIRVGPHRGGFGGAQRLFVKSDVLTFLSARNIKRRKRASKKQAGKY
jgi:hypothetical protein